MRNDKILFIKSADKGSAILVWDRNDYIKEAGKQLGDKYIYDKACIDPGPLINTIHKALEKLEKEVNECRYS